MKLPDWTRRPHKSALAAFRRGWRGVTTWTRRLIGGEIITPRRVDRWFNIGVRRVFRFVETRLGPVTVVVIVVVVALSMVFWDWLSVGESGSTTIRNLGLVVAAVVALPLAIWRSRVAQIQAETGQRELSNRLYQQGTEMLASEDLSVRLDSIYTLERLAKDEPEQYHIQIMSRFCAFVRHPTTVNGENRMAADGEMPHRRQDVQAVMTAISACHAGHLELEAKANYVLDLQGAELRGSLLRECNLSNANLVGAVLSEAKLHNADLLGADMSRAVLSETGLLGTNLREASLVLADLSHAGLDHANLSEAQLSMAKLNHALFLKSNLSDASLDMADLSEALLPGAILKGACLNDANLSGADFSDDSILYPDSSSQSGIRWFSKEEMRTTGLTQAQLDKARADPNDPPHLDGVLDAETGEQLVWRGRPLDT